MKKILFTALLLTTCSVNSAIYELETNFGMMTEFDTPQLMDWYPNSLDTNASYGPARSKCVSNDNCTFEGEKRYLGFRFALTDTFIWNDGGYITEFNNALKGDFFINAHMGGQTLSYLVEDTGNRWLYGSAFNEWNEGFEPSYLSFSLTSADPNNPSYASFVFDKNKTAFYLSDEPIRFVPETGTFALFLLSAVGLCVRRQMKQQA